MEVFDNFKDKDWHNIKVDYLSGELSVQEIAKKYEIDISLLLYRARKLAWAKDERCKRTLRFTDWNNVRKDYLENVLTLTEICHKYDITYTKLHSVAKENNWQAHFDNKRMPLRRINWEPIEHEYRVGQLTIPQIAEMYDVNKSVVYCKAYAKGWQRDLLDQVRAQTVKNLAEIDAATTTDEKLTKEKDIINGAAIRGTDIILKHRKKIEELEDIRGNIMNNLKIAVGNIATSKDVSDVTYIIESLGRTLANVVKLERQAFNIDEKAKNTDDDSLSVANSALETIRGRLFKLAGPEDEESEDQTTI